MLHLPLAVGLGLASLQKTFCGRLWFIIRLLSRKSFFWFNARLLAEGQSTGQGAEKEAQSMIWLVPSAI